MNKILSIFSLVVALSFTGCEQSDPSFNNRDGDVLTFAGRKWDIKIFKNSTWGPGNNLFHRSSQTIFLLMTMVIYTYQLPKEKVSGGLLK